MINSLTNDELRQLVLQHAENQPRVWIDEVSKLQAAAAEVQDNHENDPIPPWCSCSHCKKMEVSTMDVCCGKIPDKCHSKEPMFAEGCLSEFALEIGQICYANYRAQAPKFDNNNLRFIAYRNYIAWIFGRLGKANRKPVPSCCVLSIRGRFPDPNNRYVLYREWEAM